MFAWRQFELGDCLPFAKMEMLIVGDDRLAGLDKVRVDQNVKMAGIRVNLAGWLNNQPCGGHRLTGGHLDFKPDFILALLGPDSAHLGKGVAFDHPRRLGCFGARGKSKMPRGESAATTFR